MPGLCGEGGTLFTDDAETKTFNILLIEDNPGWHGRPLPSARNPISFTWWKTASKRWIFSIR